MELLIEPDLGLTLTGMGSWMSSPSTSTIWEGRCRVSCRFIWTMASPPAIILRPYPSPLAKAYPRVLAWAEEGLPNRSLRLCCLFVAYRAWPPLWPWCKCSGILSAISFRGAFKVFVSVVNFDTFSFSMLYTTSWSRVGWVRITYNLYPIKGKRQMTRVRHIVNHHILVCTTLYIPSK